MKKYESIILIKPTLDPKAALEVSDKMLKLLEENGKDAKALRTIEKCEKIAFEIKGGYTEAYWQVYNYQANPDFIKEFERICKIDENIVRFLTVKINEKTKSNKERIQAKERNLKRQQSSKEEVASEAKTEEN